jgi:hypothetical protein
MAVRAVEQVPPPSLADASDVRQLVAQPGRDQDPASPQSRSAGEPDVEARFDADLGVVDQAAAIAGHLGPAGRDQVVGWHAIPGQKAVHVRGRALRGTPASTTATARRARASTTAALRPAGPPPTTTTS